MPTRKTWIADRLPKKGDADLYGRVYVAAFPEHPDYSFDLDAIAEDGSAWWARVSLSDGTPTKWKQHSPLKG